MNTKNLTRRSWAEILNLIIVIFMVSLSASVIIACTAVHTSTAEQLNYLYFDASSELAAAGLVAQAEAELKATLAELDQAKAVAQAKAEARRAEIAKAKAEVAEQTKAKAEATEQTKAKAEATEQTKAKAEATEQTKVKAEATEQTKAKAEATEQTKTKAEATEQTASQAKVTTEHFENYSVTVSANDNLEIPGPPGELKVWIGISNLAPKVQIGRVTGTEVLGKVGETAKVIPFTSGIDVDPIALICEKVDPSGSEVRFRLVPKESGIFTVGATVELYTSQDCSGAPVPKSAKSVDVKVIVNSSGVIKHALKELAEKTWDSFLSFWDKALLLVFGILLILFKNKLYKWVRTLIST